MSTSAPDPISDLRQRIDALDDKLVELINERGRLAAEIGRHKAQCGTPVYSSDREQEVYRRLAAANRGPFPDAVLHAVYRELMSGSLALEKPLRIAYLGPRGSFSHLAASHKFGGAVEYEGVADIAASFAEVGRGHADFAVAPVENSIGGGVVDTLDAFLHSGVQICAEILQQIHHNLLSRVPLEQIERVYSKPEVLAQCRNWLSETGLLARVMPVASSSKAAEMAASEPGAAAIGSTLAADIYALPVLFSRIEDDPNNITRFFVVGRHAARRSGDDKTSIMFATPHRVGALVDVLELFRREGVNLTMITSRPSRKRTWEYYFFIDAEGHADDAGVARSVAAASEYCLQFTVLGSYPRATEVQ